MSFPDPLARGAAASLLLCDLYELNMMQAYLEAGMTETASFEFFVRKLPGPRGFFVAAGLEQTVRFLETARFTEPELDWLKESGRFSADFVDHLAAFRFGGEVHAMAEGTVFFPDEPMLRITAPLPEGQLLETRLINLLHFPTLIASKAARMVLAAPERTLIDFGLRRAHGAEAGLFAARAAYLAGFAGTATVTAAPAFEIPISGTMAHSFIQAHHDEVKAFENFARARPTDVVLLIDTYDTEKGATKVVDLAPRLAKDGIEVRGVRIDSGDLGAHARKVRRILDEGGLEKVQIFASGGIDEYVLRDLTVAGAPIDGYGIGTSLAASTDAAALDCAYKLQEYGGRPKRKRSEKKATWPGRKQVYRWYDGDGTMARDLITTIDDERDGEALVHPVMREGRRIADLPSLADSRGHAKEELARLPRHLRKLETEPPYPVEISEQVHALAEEADREIDAAA